MDVLWEFRANALCHASVFCKECSHRNVAGFSPSVQMNIRTVPGAKNMLFGGEGVFNTVLTCPGRVWLQTMPIYNVANAIRPYIPTGNN